MIFEKNPFTTAVSMPKSFHLTPMSPTFEIHQPTLMGQSQLCQQFYLHNKSVDTMMDGCMGGCGGNADKYLHNNP